MLRSIHVKNMALIGDEEITMNSGLNILSGETGAGKSIIIGSVNAALGTGSFKELAAEGSDQAMVELTFETSSEAVRRKLSDEGIPDLDGNVIISRTYRNGRSISRINGAVVTAVLVRELSSMLIDIHGQHEHQSLLYPKYHLALVDSFAGDELENHKKACAEAYSGWKKASSELQAALSDEKDRMRQIDFLSYEVNEIEEAALEEGEDDELESQFRRLSNAQKIRSVLGEVASLTGQDEGAGMSISIASGRISQIEDLDDEIRQLSKMLSQIDDMCSDFGRSLNSYMDDFVYDEELLDETEKRLDLINRLKSKYGRTIQDIISYMNSSKEKLEKLTDYDAYVDGLRKRVTESRTRLLEECARITHIRKEAAKNLEKKIISSLSELNFSEIKFEIHFDPLPEPSSNGADAVTFLISTNPGSPVRPLQHVASGGELSRIMLGIKTVMAKRSSIETLIFDEIDTGISGRTAQKVSEKMAQLSASCQVIAITHLAQIASMADYHYLIEKSVEDGRTRTHIKLLSDAEKVEELARILGGTEITGTVRQSAQEMLSLAAGRKKELRGQRH